MKNNKSSEKVWKEKQKPGRKVQSAFGVSLRIQLIVGFAVPILFLIGVGIISYHNASAGMPRTAPHRVL